MYISGAAYRLTTDEPSPETTSARRTPRGKNRVVHTPTEYKEGEDVVADWTYQSPASTPPESRRRTRGLGVSITPSHV